MIKELNYDITKDDLKNYAKDYLSVKRLKENRIKKSVIVFIILFILLLMLNIITIFPNVNDIQVAFVGFIFMSFVIFIFTLIFSLIIYFLESLSLRITALQLYNGMDFQNNKIIIDSEKGTFSTFDRDNNSAVNWSMIKDIYNLKYSILIFISDYRAFIIPKRIFETEQEMNETWKLIKECYDKSRGNVND